MPGFTGDEAIQAGEFFRYWITGSIRRHGWNVRCITQHPRQPRRTRTVLFLFFFACLAKRRIFGDNFKQFFKYGGLRRNQRQGLHRPRFRRHRRQFEIQQQVLPDGNIVARVALSKFTFDFSDLADGQPLVFAAKHPVFFSGLSNQTRRQCREQLFEALPRIQHRNRLGEWHAALANKDLFQAQPDYACQVQKLGQGSAGQRGLRTGNEALIDGERLCALFEQEVGMHLQARIEAAVGTVVAPPLLADQERQLSWVEAIRVTEHQVRLQVLIKELRIRRVFPNSRLQDSQHCRPQRLVELAQIGIANAIFHRPALVEPHAHVPGNLAIVLGCDVIGLS